MTGEEAMETFLKELSEAYPEFEGWMKERLFEQLEQERRERERREQEQREREFLERERQLRIQRQEAERVRLEQERIERLQREQQALREQQAAQQRLLLQQQQEQQQALLQQQQQQQKQLEQQQRFVVDERFRHVVFIEQEQLIARLDPVDDLDDRSRSEPLRGERGLSHQSHRTTRVRAPPQRARLPSTLIASRPGVQENTVEVHVSGPLRKAQVDSRASLLASLLRDARAIAYLSCLAARETR